MKRPLSIFLFLSTLMLAFAQGHAQDMLRISRIVMAQQVDTSPAPIYPQDAKAAGVEGTVALDVVISAKGDVERVRVLSGPDKLRDSATRAVSTWTYKPYKIDDVAREVDTTVILAFSLKDGGTSRDASGDAKETTADAPTQAVSGTSPASAAPSNTGIVRVSTGLIKLSGKSPQYSEAARAAEVSGSVVMRVVLSKSGAVELIEVMSGPDLLRQAAVDAVKTWTFKPFVKDSRRVEVETTIAVHFGISSLPSPPSSSSYGNSGAPRIGSGGFGPH